MTACAGASRRGDTTAIQTLGRWEWHARLARGEDSSFTIERLSIDTAAAGSDVALLRYEFHPIGGLGAASAVTLGLDLRALRTLRPGVSYTMGSASATVPAYATLTCLCPPLRSDSVRGTFLLVTRGMRQLTGRIDAAVYLSEWNASDRHVTYALHQRFDALK
ncbi:MAG TPA: hypothetical protein VN848_02755 [Gemmatimonadales bacterium]|nr:hypothetical protein [Gemmatimonadales bacterium]